MTENLVYEELIDYLKSYLEDADNCLNLITDLSKSNGNFEVLHFLKSSLIINLYGIVENISRKCLNVIHLSHNGKSFDQLDSALKEIVFEFFFKDISSPKNIRKNVDLIFSSDFKFPDFSEYDTKYKVFSGNVDARCLNDILKKYNLGRLRNINKEKLLEIKNARNKLAHGEVSFKEYGRSVVISDLIQYRKSVEDTMNSLIDLSTK